MWLILDISRLMYGRPLATRHRTLAQELLAGRPREYQPEMGKNVEGNATFVLSEQAVKKATQMETLLLRVI